MVSRRNTKKNRDVIPDSLLQSIREYLVANNRHYLLACYFLHYCFIRPYEMSFMKIGDINVSECTITIHGDHAKNHNDAILTIPKHVMRLIVDLGILSCPVQYYVFSYDFQPGAERRSEKSFRDYWTGTLRKELRFSERYKFYSLKDTGITNMLRQNKDVLSVRDQARHSSILITDTYTPKDIQQANTLLLDFEGVL